MDVLIPELSGFCPGVKRAANRLMRYQQGHPEEHLQILGPMIHNRIYLDHLQDKGIKTLDKPEDAGRNAVLVIRTHGMNRELQSSLEKDHQCLDMTCVIVKKVQQLIRTYTEQGYFVVVTGKKSHPEMMGLVSFAREYLVIEDKGGLDRLNPDGREKLPGLTDAQGILLVSQTTGDAGLFQAAADALTARFGDGKDIVIQDTICAFTSRREQQSLELQKKADISIVVGDLSSSNANKLFRVLKERESKTWFVRDLEDLKKQIPDIGTHRSALVVSSSSTPDFVERGIVDYLKSL